LSAIIEGKSFLCLRRGPTMRRRTGVVLAAVGFVLAGRSGLRADDTADKVKAQKETARANWKRLFPDEEFSHAETKLFLLYGPAVEQQAGEQLVAALVRKKAGGDVPSWVVAGLGRATAWRTNPTAYAAERGRLRAQVRTRTVKEALGGDLRPEEAAPWRASVVDYLAFG